MIETSYMLSIASLQKYHQKKYFPHQITENRTWYNLPSFTNEQHHIELQRVSIVTTTCSLFLMNSRTK